MCCQRLLTDKKRLPVYNEREASEKEMHKIDIGSRIKRFRERQQLSQEELALQIFVSRQTISNWETNKSCPDLKSLILLSDLFQVPLDSFIKEDIQEIREMVERAAARRFHMLGAVFLIELILVTVSAYPLARMEGHLGVAVWLCLFAAALYTAGKIEDFKKKHDIQTYKEVLAFLDGKPLTHDEAQQEIGKRNYQKMLFALVAAVMALAVSFLVIRLYRSLFL